jgi:hypothetical protein
MISFYTYLLVPALSTYLSMLLRLLFILLGFFCFIAS